MESNLVPNGTFHPFADGFCNDKFWDLRRIWYTDNPDFTECFESTVLVWFPCAFLWAMLPVQLFVALSRPYRVKRWTWLSLTKIVLCVVLAILAIIDSAVVLIQWTDPSSRHAPTAELLAAILKLATFVLTAIVVFMDKRRGRSTSAILFFFWLFFLISSIIAFRSVIDLAVSNGISLNGVQFSTSVIQFFVIVAQFFLSCFGERFIELEVSEKNPCPEQYASFLSKLTYWWFNPMAYLGWKKPLVMHDLWTLLPEDKTKVSVEELEKYWDIEMDRRKQSMRKTGKDGEATAAYEPSFIKVLWKTYWFQFVSSGSLRLFNDLAVFISPQILSLIIGFVQNPKIEPWKGYLYATAMLVGAYIQTTCLNYYLHVCLRLGMHVRASVVAIVYRKALRITSEAKRSSNVGEIVNLMSVDAQRFMDITAWVHLLWGAPLQMALAMYFLWDLLGISVLAGLVTLILTVPVNAVVVTKVRGLQVDQMKEKDGRIKMMTEILNGMKVLKLYAWEQSFQDLVTAIRERELTTLSKAAYLGVISYFCWVMSPFLVALATFATYVLVDPVNNVLTAQRVFVALALLNILRVPLTLLPSTITMTIQVAISIKRLGKFLKNEELDLDTVKQLPLNDPLAVKVSTGTFSWGKQDPACLNKIELAIKHGQLVAVVGQVGSGKSSLCAAILGLMEKIQGEVAIKGEVAYVPQQAWIQNLTLKENILFGKKMEQDRYERTLDSCSLRPDLAMLAGGDETEIGERGTNMSGGQRQRISLARAVFSDADVYVLDDPLSAVDAHVGKHIFENVIGPHGMLRGKTRLLVTHGIGFLPQTDLIVVLDNGTIRETGTYKQLLKQNGAFAQFLRTYLTEAETADEPVEDPTEAAVLEEIKRKISVVVPEKADRDRSGSTKSRVSIRSARKIKDVFHRDSIMPVESGKKPAVEEVAGGKGKLVDEEKSETGGVKWSIYLLFAKEMSYWAVAGLTVMYGISYGMSAAANFWLGQWGEDSAHPERKTEGWRDFRLGVYALFGILQGVFVIIATLCLAYGRIRASRHLHNTMLERIMHAPMAFFDTTPMGRIVNRFSKDVDTIDVMLPQTLDVWLYCAYSVLTTVVVICVNTPWFSVLFIPLGAFYYFMQRFFISTSRQLKRLEAVSRSPIFSHFQESISGTSVIIATKQMGRFITENEHRVDINNASYYPNIVSQRWIVVRLEFVGICLSFFTALYAVIGRDIPAWGVSPDTIGLSISYSLAINQILNWFVRMTSDLESNVVSVERIKEYAEIETEAEWIKPDARPPPDWPTAGHVEFRDYKTRYRPELDLVLKGVSADIASGEKIGIVGRTGAGKSSLTLALFRVIEAADGSILIDGKDIAQLGLHDVRSRITILPQEPVLFSGSLRMNLDPFNKFSDDDIWYALENSHLQRFVSSLPEGLNHHVADGGENYSVGQRQLICLARALLRKTKVLVLDEATAAIDLETDDLIQCSWLRDFWSKIQLTPEEAQTRKYPTIGPNRILLQRTISEKFADCTILTIAHRINTIMDSTRIMVLDQGRVKEFDSPKALLKDHSSIFYSLAKTANLA